MSYESNPIKAHIQSVCSLNKQKKIVEMSHSLKSEPEITVTFRFDEGDPQELLEKLTPSELTRFWKDACVYLGRYFPEAKVKF